MTPTHKQELLAQRILDALEPIIAVWPGMNRDWDDALDRAKRVILKTIVKDAQE